MSIDGHTLYRWEFRLAAVDPVRRDERLTLVSLDEDGHEVVIADRVIDRQVAGHIVTLHNATLGSLS